MRIKLYLVAAMLVGSPNVKASMEYIDGGLAYVPIDTMPVRTKQVQSTAKSQIGLSEGDLYFVDDAWGTYMSPLFSDRIYKRGLPVVEEEQPLNSPGAPSNESIQSLIDSLCGHTKKAVIAYPELQDKPGSPEGLVEAN